GTPPAKSFAASAVLTHKSCRIILRALITWAAAAFLLGAVITVCVQILADILVPLTIDSVIRLALSFGLLAAIWLTTSVLATAFTTGSLAFILAALAHQLGLQLSSANLQLNPQRVFIPAKMTRRWYAFGFIAAVGIAAFIGFALLDEISITDNAQIIAHRGAAGAAPENTLASIRHAIKDGADWIEIDVQENADGEVVVIHDSDFMKLAGVDLRVWEASTKQLAEIDIGSWFAPEFADDRVPTLADVLAEVKGRSKLIVELKYYGHDQQLEQRVIDLIEAVGMQDDTMIMSLEYAGIQKVRALRPNWKIGLLSARAIGDLTRLDADFLAVNMSMASPALINAAHGAGKELFVWTVNDALSMSQMMSIGVDGVITDEPLLGREVLTVRAELSSVQRLLLHVAPLMGIESPSLNFKSNDAERDDSNINLELSLQQRLQDQLSSEGSVLAEFTTDGCSGGLSVGWDYFAEQAGFFRDRHGKRPPWENCCIDHDKTYHVGGGEGLTPAQGFAARLQADDELRACVVETATDRTDQLRAEYGVDDDQVAALYETIADSMYLAVRLGGMPCTGLSWRWGYGWPNCH
ncbi:MAG: glycerophosphodiester phosphodiesterase, partial [Xanthomonadales bacterium]|nr:glycerophosphodiester phosphodiesterase [Xanthomonadales bacterium]